MHYLLYWICIMHKWAFLVKISPLFVVIVVINFSHFFNYIFTSYKNNRANLNHANLSQSIIRWRVTFFNAGRKLTIIAKLLTNFFFYNLLKNYTKPCLKRDVETHKPMNYRVSNFDTISTYIIYHMKRWKLRCSQVNGSI